MKDKLILFIIGLLVGAIISTGAFYVYTLTNSCTNGGQLPEMQNSQNNQPPEKPDGDNIQPPEKPSENNTQDSNQNNN